MASANPDPYDPWGVILGQVAAMSVELARSLQQRALETESVDEAVKLAGAFNGVARGVRQTLALDAKLIRERRDQQADAQRDAAAKAEARRQLVAARHAAIRSRVERFIWTEYEKPEEADFLVEELYAHLDGACHDEDFLEGTVEEAAQRFREALPILADGAIDPEVFAQAAERIREAEAWCAHLKGKYDRPGERAPPPARDSS